MAEYGGSVSSNMGGRSPALAALSAERKAAKNLALFNMAPAAHKNRFVVATQYYVGGDQRVNFQLKTLHGNVYASRPISAIEAQRLNAEFPGIVVVKQSKGYSLSRGPGKGRTHDFYEIDAHSRGRSSAHRASIIPTKEFKYIANEHGLSPKVTNSIIRDMDELGYTELDEAREHGLTGSSKRNSIYGWVKERQYAPGSEQDLRAKRKAKAKREAIKAMYPDKAKYAKKYRKATARATANFLAPPFIAPREAEIEFGLFD